MPGCTTNRPPEPCLPEARRPWVGGRVWPAPRSSAPRMAQGAPCPKRRGGSQSQAEPRKGPSGSTGPATPRENMRGPRGEAGVLPTRACDVTGWVSVAGLACPAGTEASLHPFPGGGRRAAHGGALGARSIRANPVPGFAPPRFARGVGAASGATVLGLLGVRAAGPSVLAPRRRASPHHHHQTRPEAPDVQTVARKQPLVENPPSVVGSPKRPSGPT